MRNAESQRGKPRFCSGGERVGLVISVAVANGLAPSFLRPSLQQLQHFYVVWIGRIVVVRYLVVRLWSLQNERYTVRARVLHEPLEGLLANASLPYENMSILVRSEFSVAVVQVEERRRFSSGILEFVEHRLERLLRFGDVIARGKEVARIESVARSPP